MGTFKEQRRWERLGFHPFLRDDPTETDLYLLASEIEATLGHLVE